MARYRIVQRPSRLCTGTHVYDIEERFVFWWNPLSPSWLSLESAEQALNDIRIARQ
jgi:hypothetical protein